MENRHNNIEFTILMPCLNEEKTVAACVKKALKWIEKSGVNGEVLVVDNGSTDNSVKKALSAGARVVRESRKGYGNALKKGIKEAYGKYTIMGDCDLSYDFEHLDGYAEKLREGYAFVNGNRFKGRIKKGAMPTLHKVGVPALSILGRIRYGTEIGDFHCGLRGFDTKKARKLHLKSDGMEFATEIIGRFSESGERMCEIPTTLSPDGRNRPPHLRTIRDGIRHIILMLRPLK